MYRDPSCSDMCQNRMSDSYVSRGLACLYCDRAVNITDCLTQIASCQDGIEECFLDWTVLPDLTAVFTAGCRSKQVCNLISSAFGKRESKRTVGCSQCCNSPPNSRLIPCNGYLCKQAPVAEGKSCGICDRVSDQKDCSVDQACQPSEVCIVQTLFTGGLLKYELGCEQKTICDKILREYKSTHTKVFPAGKRADHGSLVLCMACCDGISCNKDYCRNVLKPKPATTLLFVDEY
ncbi:unnamed protein product [Mytilus coruscus]|uniref:Uncharacterized protein n=1 Tax=Mytilus coruscus TaxID=42192 RepID=A0A6J8EBZ6_MYTCO|nr:unnamed protein product [Mytilus coruscus]